MNYAGGRWRPADEQKILENDELMNIQNSSKFN